jgi:hypothetical protein
MGLVADDFFHYGQDVYLMQQTVILDGNKPTLNGLAKVKKVCHFVRQ